MFVDRVQTGIEEREEKGHKRCSKIPGFRKQEEKGRDTAFPEIEEKGGVRMVTLSQSWGKSRM